MAITTLAMVATVLVGNLYEMKDRPVPTWAKKILMVHVARLLCVCDCAHDSTLICQENDEKTSERLHLVTLLNPYAVARLPIGRCTTNISSRSSSGEEDPWRRRHRSLERRTQSRGTEKDQRSVTAMSNSRRLSRSKRLSAVQKATLPPEPSSFVRVNFASDWAHVAAVCDRFFFWLCLLFIAVTTLLLFHPLTTSRFFRLPILERTAHWTLTMHSTIQQLLLLGY